MRLVPQEVGTLDLGVRDGDHPVVGRENQFRFGRPDKLTRERAAPLVRIAGAHAGALAEEAAEVVGLGERTLGAR